VSVRVDTGQAIINSINSAVVGTAWTSASVQGDSVDMAIDFDNREIWFRRNQTGNWNNSGTANPSTNTDGFSLSTFAAGPYFLASGLDSQDEVTTTNFNPPSPPTGFISY